MANLDDMIAGLRGLGSMAERTAQIAAPMIEADLRASASAGRSPTGEAWAPRKKDGARAMANAAAHVTAKALGPVVRVTLTGPDVFHHFAARGEPRRQVIPDSGVDAPPGIAAALERASDQAWAEAMR